MSAGLGRCGWLWRAAAPTGAMLALCAATSFAQGQGACDVPAVRTYVTDLGGGRGAPPAAWQKCVDSMRVDPYGDAKAAILHSFAALRSRAGQARDPGEEEKRLFKGAGRAMIRREMLEGWRTVLGADKGESRFENVFYQAFLGSLSLIVLDRSDRLETACVAPVVALRGAVTRGPAWRDIEAALRALGDVPLWKDASADDLSLTRLRDQAAGMAPADLRGACDKVRALPAGPGYWAALARELGQIKGSVVTQTRPVPGAASAVALDIPPGCRLASCQTAKTWQASPGKESWGRLLEKFDADLAGVERRLSSAKSALPAGIVWKPSDDRLKGLKDRSARLRQAKEPGGTDAAQEVARGLKDLDDMTAVAGEMDDVVASARVVNRLLAGDVRQAKQIVGERKSWKGAPAPLVAAYVTARYWETGSAGWKSACGSSGIDCARDDVAKELARVARVLGVPEEKFAALKMSDTP